MAISMTVVGKTEINGQLDPCFDDLSSYMSLQPAGMSDWF